MKRLILTILLVIGIAACSNPNEEGTALDNKIWKEGISFSQSNEVLADEIDRKVEKVKAFLAEESLDGMLLTQMRNVFWITAGQLNSQIVLNKDLSAVSLLITKEGRKYVICNGSEAGRVMNETLSGLGYELKEYPWYNANPAKDVRGDILKEIIPKGKIGSDVDFPNTVNVSGEFKPLRYEFTESEIKRYKWLGEQTTEAVAEVCKNIKPGMNEYELEAITAAELRSRGIMPTVLLMAVDDRIYKYRHALPGGAELEKYAMINVVAEKWGMPIAVTRFVHFGELPEELKTKLEKTAVVNAHYQKYTRPGVKGSEIFEMCKEWYANVGYKGEWQKHHQGGAIGYDDREWVIYPHIEKTVHANQAFAWNPTITGAKIEETIIVKENGFDVVTKSPDWPMIIVNLDGEKYPQPGILIRDPETGKVMEKEDYTIE